MKPYDKVTLQIKDRHERTIEVGGTVLYTYIQDDVPMCKVVLLGFPDPISIKQSDCNILS